MRILGIDPGSRIAGFGCIESGIKGTTAFKIVDAGVIKLTATASFTERLGTLYQTIDDLIDELQPEMFCIEKAFTFINPSSALKLGEIRGACLACALKHKLPIGELAPKTVKMLITGNGNASKQQVSTFVEKILKFQRGALPYDVTDALAIALSQGLQRSL
jgi:crossover junction endodeoxyribonuclease RuvC